MMELSAEEGRRSEITKKMHKTSGYVRTVVAIHNLRDKAKEAREALQEKSLADHAKDSWEKTRQAVSTKARNFFTHPDNVQCEHIPENYSYIFRPKSRWELVLLSGTVCGIEFCYAAETAFVTPILLSLGLNIKFVTMIWCLSPLIGFFVTPILGSLSDSCESRFGRRRPFILLLSLGILLGLIFVPNGHRLGIALGDTPHMQVISKSPKLFNDTSNKAFEGNITQNLRNMDKSELQSYIQTSIPVHNAKAQTLFTNSSINVSPILNETYIQYVNVRRKRNVGKGNIKSPKGIKIKDISGLHVQPWSITFTVLGTVLLDFCSDACQSPSRTYLLDVSLPEDHPAGLSTFTLMAGLGGSIGYLMGAVHWEATFLGNWLGGQVNVVFTIVTFVFLICLICTLRSFPEIPLPILKDPKVFKEYQQKLQIGEYLEKRNELELIESKGVTYGTTTASEELGDAAPSGIPNGVSHMSEVTKAEPDDTSCVPAIPIVPAVLDIPSATNLDSEHPTLKEYLRSIIHMPKSLRILCLTNLFCWMSLVCYSLYFTDFVGEVVYGGDPQAAEDSELYKLFKDGVSFGCWGMALYSISCSVYSYFIEALVIRFGAKRVYIGGQLIYSVGMIIMAAARHPAAVILLSPTAGVMYSTLFTMPYLLIAHYHCMQQFRDDKLGGETGIRGIGTDVASVSSMVFLSQFILSLTMGSIVEAVGSNVATVCAAALLSACGAACATQVMYLDM